MLLKYIVCFIAILVVQLEEQSPFAQKPYFQAAVSAGKIIKHSPKFNFDITAPAFSTSLSLHWQTRGSKDWHQLQNFPRFYIAAQYHHLGDKAIVGEAISTHLGIEVNLLRKKKSALHFSFGTGLAYLTQAYDRIDNTENNVIGSHWNNNIDLKFDYEQRISEKIQLHFGIGLSHYSNGTRKLPNLGYNIPNVFIAVSPYQGTYDKDYFTKKPRSKFHLRKWGLAAQFQYAQIQIRAPGGPKYPIYVANIDSYYHLKANHKLSIGYQYDFNSGIATFGLNTGDFVDHSEARRGASRHSINIGNEFVFGPWAVQLKTGLYLNRQQSFLLPKAYYFLLSPKYYLINIPNTFKLFTGINLKSHLFTAEYISWGVGVEF